MRRLLAFLLCLCGLLSVAQAEKSVTHGPLTDALAAAALPDGAAVQQVHASLVGWCNKGDLALAQAAVTLTVHCEVENEAGNWTLLRFIAGGYRLATARIDMASGEVRLPTEETLRALHDGAFLRAALTMHDAGIEVQLDCREQRVTEALAISWLVRAYEARMASIPLAGVIIAPDAPDFLRKAAVIGLLSPSELIELDTPQSTLTRMDWTVYLLRWAAIVEREVCRRAAAPATLNEGMAALQLAADLAGYPLDASKVWPGNRSKTLPLTRARYARTATTLLKMTDPRKWAERARSLPLLDDGDDAAEQEACDLGLMRYVSLEPDGFACFDPTRVMSLEEVWEHAIRFVLSVQSYQGDAIEKPFSIAEALPSLQHTLDEVDRLARYEGPIVRVDNGGDTPWYFAQDDSGPCSEANCMPASAAMVLHWLHPDSAETPESLRNAYPLDGAPWYPEQVSSVFREHKVGYTMPEVACDRMVQALDAGHILLVLLNETGSGHSVVVKGYVREGEGLWFTVYDPASPSADAFGRPIGLNRRMEASQLLAAMECHWWLLFDISREPADATPID